MATAIETEPTKFKTDIVRGLRASAEPRIVRDGGDFGAGLIRQASIITRGEASGHGVWVDEFAVNQTAEAINATDGTKVRFTHPGLSSDGLGKLTARAKNATVVGDQAFADLHIVESARNTPDGDLGDYVMSLAENDSDMFGVSIVFDHDPESEEEFKNDHFSEGSFSSPDNLNAENLPHVRLAKLHAADIVDEPAANPSGLFSRQDEFAREAYSLAEFVCGINENKPESSSYGFDPERAKQFFQRFLSNQNLEVVPQMTTTTEPQLTRKEEGELFKKEFGEVLGSKYFADGMEFDEAKEQHVKDVFAQKDAQIETLNAAIEQKEETIRELSAKLDAAAEFTGEKEPVETIESRSPEKKLPFRSVERN